MALEDFFDTVARSLGFQVERSGGRRGSEVRSELMGDGNIEN